MRDSIDQMIEISSSSGSFTAPWKYYDFTTLVQANESAPGNVLQAPCRADGGGGVSSVMTYVWCAKTSEPRPCACALPVPE